MLVEVERVWRRNPHRPLAHLLTFATAGSGTFLPEDASDTHVLARLRSVAPGEPAAQPAAETPAVEQVPA